VVGLVGLFFFFGRPGYAGESAASGDEMRKPGYARESVVVRKPGYI
jgi:hypothetical protein